MKSITEYKDYIAKKHGYKDFLNVLKSFDCANSTYSEVNIIINEAMQEYAGQCCEEQIKACAENATIKTVEKYSPEYDLSVYEPFIDKDSILNTPNVVTTNTK